MQRKPLFRDQLALFDAPLAKVIHQISLIFFPAETVEKSAKLLPIFQWEVCK
jgi:hypothetical protein